MSGIKYSSGILQMKRENSFSQLNTFKESKKDILKIFSEIFDYMNDSNVFLRSIHNSDAMFQALINVDNVKLLSNFVEKVKGIQSVISRDNMKCAFFGRTSNGKSTTINAMLGDRILPAGIGHTTSCFLEIRGTKESQGSVSIISSPKPGSDSSPVELVDHKLIDSVRELARDVCSNKLSTDSLIRIDWPSQKCALLSEDVVILDSPGIDVDPDIDQWIDMYCLDADVFVLVANSESTLNHTEKAFFHKVRDRLSKPNVFILNNRWDASAEQIEYVKEAREQHLERCVTFLTKELKVCSKTEAENRVFFVSATEALSLRGKKNESGSGDPTSLDSPGSKRLREGWQSRLFEFTNFEKNLEKTLSESATKTKFAAHSSQGQDIVGEVRCIVEALNEKAQEQKDAAVSLTHRMRTRCDKLASLRGAARDESIADISRLSAKVAERVADVLREELLRLGDVIDEFDQNFYEETGLLAKYKIDLSQHVERQLGNNMASLCGRDLCNQVQAVSTAILKRYLALIQDKDVSEGMRQSVCDDYVPEFYIDCNNISSDFHEDLSFRFSWGPTAVLSKVIGPLSPSRNPVGLSLSQAGVFSLLSMQQLLPKMTGRAVLATVLCGGLVLKATGWKMLGACAAIYALMYGYEYSTWTPRAKERAFKTQFRSYVAEKLELMMALTSKHSAEQPQFALKTTLKRLDAVVDGHAHKLRADVARFENDIQRLEEIVAKSRNLKNTALYLEKVLKGFHDKYILV